MMLELKELEAADSERVVVGRDGPARLHAVIAIHSTALGPALGGVRMWPYPDERAAVADALRLARAMTYKAAMAGLELGGGKAVLIGDPARDKSRPLFLALGRMIESLGGRYIAAEDVGVTVEDLDVIAERTTHLTGAGERHGGSGDCSEATARGVLLGIEAAVEHALGRHDLSGLRVAIQGVGKVGRSLARSLHERGARLIVSDVRPQRCEEAAGRWEAEVLGPEAIHAADADVLAPCALGGVLNDRTIPEIRAKVVAGGANNQFADEQRGPAALARRGILHAPDFVINAGGLIRLYALELRGEPSEEARLQRIPAALAEVFHMAREQAQPPLLIANRMAEERLRAGSGRR